jgi:hypothetical protein
MKESVTFRALPSTLCWFAQIQSLTHLPTTASWSIFRCAAIATISGLSGVVQSNLIQSPAMVFRPCHGSAQIAIQLQNSDLLSSDDNIIQPDEFRLVDLHHGDDFSVYAPPNPA